MDFAAKVMKSMPELYGLTPEQVDQMISLSMQHMPDIQGMAFMLGVGKGEAPVYNEMIAALRVPNAEKYMGDYRSYWHEFEGMLPEFDSPLFKDIQLDEVTLNGKPAFKMSLPMEAFAQMQFPEGEIDFESMMETLYGADGLTTYMAAADQNTILFAYSDTKLIEATLKSFAGGEGIDGITLDADVNQTASMLPTGGQFIAFWDIAGSVAFINRVSKLIGDRPAELPEFPNAPPIGWTMIGEPGSLRSETVVPAELLEAIGMFAEEIRGRQVAEHVARN